MATQFLLTLHYPTLTLPVGLFRTEKQALEYAAEHPLRALDLADDDDDDDIKRAHAAHPIEYDNLGCEENDWPLGYAITLFVNGVPENYAVVEPWVGREVVTQKKDPPKPKAVVDPKQTLVW